MWVARDKNKKLWLFTEKPIRDKNILGYWVCSCNCMELDSSLFPDLKWEDEPLEVCLCINNEKYHNIDWLYQDIKETLETYFDIVDNYRKLPWYKRIFTNI